MTGEQDDDSAEGVDMERESMARRTKDRSRARRVAIGVATLLAVVALAAACDPEPYVGRANGPRIAFVGDSLTQQMHETVETTLVDRGWNVSMTSRPGYTTRDHWDTEAKLQSSNPDAIVLALGTNDMREINAGLQTWDGIRESVRHSIDLTRGTRCLVWAGINEISGFYGPGAGNLAEFGWVVNVIIQQELAASGRAPGSTYFADWAGASRNHPEYFVAPGDVHHSAEGQRAFFRVIDASLSQCQTNPVFGWVDGVAGGNGSVSVAGWVIDPFVDRATDVHVYVDSVGYAVRANGSRPDVDAAFNRGSDHGFWASLPASPGSHRVCVYGIAGGQPGRWNILLGCRTVTVGAAPPTTTTTTSRSTTSTTSSTTTTTSTPPTTVLTLATSTTETGTIPPPLS